MEIPILVFLLFLYSWFVRISWRIWIKWNYIKTSFQFSYSTFSSKYCQLLMLSHCADISMWYLLGACLWLFRSSTKEMLLPPLPPQGSIRVRRGLDIQVIIIYVDRKLKQWTISRTNNRSQLQEQKNFSGFHYRYPIALPIHYCRIHYISITLSFLNLNK